MSEEVRKIIISYELQDIHCLPGILQRLQDHLVQSNLRLITISDLYQNGILVEIYRIS